MPLHVKGLIHPNIVRAASNKHAYSFISTSSSAKYSEFMRFIYLFNYLFICVDVTSRLFTALQVGRRSSSLRCRIQSTPRRLHGLCPTISFPRTACADRAPSNSLSTPSQSATHQPLFVQRENARATLVLLQHRGLGLTDLTL